MFKKMISRRDMLKLTGTAFAGTILASCTPQATIQPTTQPQSTSTNAPGQPTATAAPTSTVAPVLPTSTKAPVTINLIRPGMGDDALKEVEAEFKPFYEKYPYITVTPLVIAPGDVATKLQTAVAGGVPPDIAMTGNDALTYIANGQVLDLAPYAVKEGFDWQNYFFPENIALWNPAGKLYGISETSSSQTLGYNKDMFDAAGLDYPNEAWTWDDLVTAAQKLTKDTTGGSTINQWGFADNTFNYQAWINSAGSSLFNKDFTALQDDAAVVEAYQWLADLIFKYKVSPPQSVRSSFPQVDFMFPQSQLAMVITSWVPDVAIFFAGTTVNYDVTLTPKHPTTGIRPSIKLADCNCVFSATKTPDEAYLVWKWLNSDEGNYARSVGNTGIPILPGGPAEKWPLLTNAFSEVKAPPANAKAFIDALAYTKLQNTNLGNETELYAAIDPILDELWLGTKGAAEVVPLMKAAADPILQNH